MQNNDKEKQGFLKGIFSKMSLNDYQKEVLENISLKNRDKLNLQALDKYLSDGGNPNVRVGKDKTPLLHTLNNIEQIKIALEYGADINIKNQYGKTLAQTLIDNKHSQLLHDLQNYISQNQNNHSKVIDILNKNDNEIYNISKKIQEQEQKLKDLKSDNVQSRDIKIEPKKEKNDADFLNQIYKFKSDLSPNIGLDNDDFEVNLHKVESDIKNVKDDSAKVDVKIDDLSNSSLSQTQKDKLFAELEKDILNLKSAVQKLKDENQNLKKELELLIEKNKVESQKIGLEKQNESLTSKIESLKNKTQNLKNEFESDSKNKITYKDKPESQVITDYENLNDNQKER